MIGFGGAVVHLVTLKTAWARVLYISVGRGAKEYAVPVPRPKTSNREKLQQVNLTRGARIAFARGRARMVVYVVYISIIFSLRENVARGRRCWNAAISVLLLD